MDNTQLLEVGETAETNYRLAYADGGDDFAFRKGKVVEVIPDPNCFEYMIDFGKPVRSGSGQVSGPIVRIPQTFLTREVPVREIPYKTFLQEVEQYKTKLSADMNNEQRHLILHGLQTLLNRAIAIKQ
jgi:hypothetical protein